MVDIRTLNPGDRVRIVDRWPADGSAGQNTHGGMDKWLGMVMTVRSPADEDGCVKMVDDQGEGLGYGGWYWLSGAIACVVKDTNFSPCPEEVFLATLSI